MYKFSKKSLSRLKTCHEDLQKVMRVAIHNSPYDFGITSGYRSPDEQRELYQKGRSKHGNIVTYCDGYIRKSKHNYSPSNAVDITCYVSGKITWNESVYLETALHILEIAEDMFLKGEIDNRVFWGGHFKKFCDFPHFQI